MEMMMIPGEVAIHGNLIYKEYNLYQLYQASKHVRTHLRLQTVRNNCKLGERYLIGISINFCK